MAAKKQAQVVSSDLPRLAAPARRALASIRVAKLPDLQRVSEAELMELHGMGPSALAAIKIAMKARKLRFAKR